MGYFLLCLFFSKAVSLEFFKRQAQRSKEKTAELLNLYFSFD
jgi:hypothetical protein